MVDFGGEPSHPPGHAFEPCVCLCLPLPLLPQMPLSTLPSLSVLHMCTSGQSLCASGGYAYGDHPEPTTSEYTMFAHLPRRRSINATVKARTTPGWRCPQGSSNLSRHLAAALKGLAT